MFTILDDARSYYGDEPCRTLIRAIVRAAFPAPAGVALRKAAQRYVGALDAYREDELSEAAERFLDEAERALRAVLAELPE